MAIRSLRWSYELASGPAYRRRATIRLVPRVSHLLMSSQVAFEPPADMYELDDAVMVRLEVAGLQPNYAEINVEIRDDQVTVTGERRDPASGLARRYEQMEIETGPFQRTLHLPCPVDETGAVARYEDGFLVIRLPKRTTPRGGALIVRID